MPDNLSNKLSSNEEAEHAIDYLTKLPNGLTLAWDDLGAVGTSAMAFFVGVGSRHEAQTEWGAAHFLEHLVFKGAGSWPASELANRMDLLGGDINAFTSRDYTCFYAKVLQNRSLDSLELLRVLVEEAWLTNPDVERERRVIAEEYREAQDDLEDRSEEAYYRALFRDPALAHEILGSPNHIESMTAGQIREFYHKWYRPDNMVVAITGQAFQEFRTMVERWGIQTPKRAPRSAFEPAPIPTLSNGEFRYPSPAEQTHLTVGVAAPCLGDPEYYATLLLATILGGQNSSRLWQRLREREGLVYTVSTSYAPQADWGDLAIYLALEPDSAQTALRLVNEEIQCFVADGPDSAELDRALVQMESHLVFGLETPDGRMFRLGRYALMGQSPPSPQTMMDRLRRVTADEIRNLAGRLWKPDRIAIGASGKIPDGLTSMRSYLE